MGSWVQKHSGSDVAHAQTKRSQECERGTHECVRHVHGSRRERIGVSSWVQKHSRSDVAHAPCEGQRPQTERLQECERGTSIVPDKRASA
jgi:hypothetical protein